MKVAIVGSRTREIFNLEDYLPEGVDTIISGGAVGMDRCAARYAHKHGIRLIEILPDYKSYGRAAPIKRNVEIIEAADLVIAFWDGKSKGTEFVIKHCKKINKPIRVELI